MSSLSIPILILHPFTSYLLIVYINGGVWVRNSTITRPVMYGIYIVDMWLYSCLGFLYWCSHFEPYHCLLYVFYSYSNCIKYLQDVVSFLGPSEGASWIYAQEEPLKEYILAFCASPHVVWLDWCLFVAAEGNLHQMRWSVHNSSSTLVCMQ